MWLVHEVHGQAVRLDGSVGVAGWLGEWPSYEKFGWPKCEECECARAARGVARWWVWPSVEGRGLPDRSCQYLEPLLGASCLISLAEI